MSEDRTTAPIVLRHPASTPIYLAASNDALTSHREAEAMALTIAVLERKVGNVPAFVDPHAEAWLLEMAEHISRPGQFRVRMRTLKNTGLAEMPPGVRMLGGIFHVDGADCARARRQLLAMAKQCAGSDEGANFKVLLWRIERAIRDNRDGGT